MNISTRNPTLHREVHRFVDVPDLVGRNAAAIKEAIEETKSLSTRAERYSPGASYTDFLKERARMMEAGEMSDEQIAKLGTAETWRQNYESSTELLWEAHLRRRVVSYKQFRGLYGKIEAALVARHKAAAKIENELAEAAGIPYEPSSGALSLSDTIEVLRRRLKTADENPERAPDLTEYFAAILK